MTIKDQTPQDDFVQELIGFPPYYKPEIGVAFTCILEGLDATNPKFCRYNMRATRQPLKCFRGPVDNQETITVNPGECFSLSEYAGISREKLQFYVGVEIKLTLLHERNLPVAKGEEPRTFIDWDLGVSSSAKQLVDTRKRQLMLEARKPVEPDVSTKDDGSFLDGLM